MVSVDKATWAIGFLFSIFGATLLGVSAGAGMVLHIATSRLVCEPAELLPEKTAACQDILGATEPLILWAALGGVAVFLSGLVTMGYSDRVGR